MNISQAVFKPVLFRGFEPSTPGPWDTEDTNPTSRPSINNDAQDVFESMQNFQANLKRVADDINQPRDVRRAMRGMLQSLTENPYPSQQKLTEMMDLLEQLAINTDLESPPKINASGSLLSEVKSSAQEIKSKQRNEAQLATMGVRRLVRQINKEWQASGGQRTERLEKLEERLYEKLQTLEKQWVKKSELGETLSFLLPSLGGMALILGGGIILGPTIGIPTIVAGIASVAFGIVNDKDLFQKPRHWLLKTKQNLTARGTAKKLDRVKAYEPPEHIRQALIKLATTAATKK